MAGGDFVAKEKYDLVVIGLKPNSSFGERSNSVFVISGVGLVVDGKADDTKVEVLTFFSRKEKEDDVPIGGVNVVDVNLTLGPSPRGRIGTTEGVGVLRLLISSL